METLRKRLKEARLNKKMTRAKVAEVVGIHKQYVADMENGRRTPSVKMLYKLSKAYEVPVYWFFLPEGYEYEISFPIDV